MSAFPCTLMNTPSKKTQAFRSRQVQIELFIIPINVATRVKTLA